NSDVFDLYSVSTRVATAQASTPFVQNIMFHSGGSRFETRCLVDHGAMTGGIRLSFWEKMKDTMEGWTTTDVVLRMVNGAREKSRARWVGTVSMGGFKAQGCFEVFDSSDEWDILVGKPLLQ
ncbi:hypothetical protein DL96DRAFT_1433077, partial [Flagelloscypha sp. PMI_526]